jgi:tRNA(Ile2) C34 agmatinyltransferase TiaS
MKRIKLCPKCGAKGMKWTNKGDKGYYECDECGYTGINANEEDADENPEIAW